MRRLGPVLIGVAICGLFTVELFSIDPAIALRQAAWVGLGLMAFLVFYKGISLDYLKRFSGPFYWLSVALLVGVLILGGPGAKRWFSFGFLKFQPSELAKLAVLLVLSRTLAQRPVSVGKVWSAVGYSALVFALIFIEPDLATSASIAVLASVMLFASGADLGLLALMAAPVLAAPASASLWLFLGLIAAGFGFARWLRKSWGYTLALLTLIVGVGLVTPLIWNKALKPYQRKRILAFVAPSEHKTTAAWQSMQARIAIGSGGLVGKGYGKGTQKSLNFLPEPHTDFIFAAAAEEFGFLGSVVVLALFSLLLWTLVRATVFLEDPYLRNLGVGVIAVLFYHVTFNLLSVLGLFPVAGIPLPFASYGGSHLLMEFSLLGLVAAAVEEQMRRMSY